MPTFNPATTALILIDLQNGIVAFPLGPRTGPEVVEAGKTLAQRFRTAGAPVVLVNVGWAKDFGDALKAPVDVSHPAPEGGFPANWSVLVDGLAQPGDILVTKHQWGAFYGTDLDVQLRRRGVKTVVIGGIATNMGVESTARQAHEAGYEVVIAEDASTGLGAELHDFAVTKIFPMLSRVVKAEDVVFQG